MLPDKTQTKEQERSLSLIIAGGGTGGHLFPGIAVAEEVMAVHADNRVRFIGTGNPFETRILGHRGFEHHHIRVKHLKGKSIFRQITALAAIPKSIAASVGILRTTRPNVVLGVGGYSAGPVVLAAWMLGIPRALHEQNVIPGMTNRMLSAFADRIYVSFEGTRLKAGRNKLVLTGNPVRHTIRPALEDSTFSKTASWTPQNPFTVFIVGGSQGAHRINTTVMAALAYIKFKDNMAFIHQTGAADEHDVAKAYGDHHVAATVKPFFNQMEKHYRKADLVICRAGASTIAELAVLGKCVLFIPYPFAADDHQAANARQFVSAGAAEMILEKDLTAQGLAQTITSYASSHQKRRSMAENIRKLARPEAAHTIVEDLYKLSNAKD